MFHKHYKKICNVAIEGVEMVYKCYKKIRNMTVQSTNWWELSYGLSSR